MGRAKQIAAQHLEQTLPQKKKMPMCTVGKAIDTYMTYIHTSQILTEYQYEWLTSPNDNIYLE